MHEIDCPMTKIWNEVCIANVLVEETSLEGRCS